MTNEELITMFKMMNTDNFIDHEKITDEDFLHIVEKWTDIIEDTGLCGGLEHFTLIECKKALEKQIPKKWIKGNVYCACPTCNHEMPVQRERCDHCGQVIDW